MAKINKLKPPCRSPCSIPQGCSHSLGKFHSSECIAVWIIVLIIWGGKIRWFLMKRFQSSSAAELIMKKKKIKKNDKPFWSGKLICFHLLYPYGLEWIKLSLVWWNIYLQLSKDFCRSKVRKKSWEPQDRTWKDIDGTGQGRVSNCMVPALNIRCWALIVYQLMWKHHSGCISFNAVWPLMIMILA